MLKKATYSCDVGVVSRDLLGMIIEYYFRLLKAVYLGFEGSIRRLYLYRSPFEIDTVNDRLEMDSKVFSLFIFSCSVNKVPCLAYNLVSSYLVQSNK